MCVSEYESMKGSTTIITKSQIGKKPFTSTYTHGSGAVNAYGVIIKHRSGPTGTVTPKARGAGIGIGVSVGVLGLALIVGGVYFLLRLRKKKKKKKKKKKRVLAYADTDYPAYSTECAELGSDHVTKVPQEISAGPTPPQELDSR
jgi:hypothetical protein